MKCREYNIYKCSRERSGVEYNESECEYESDWMMRREKR